MRTPTLLHDDREKTPWVLPGFEHGVKRLKFGDYTIKGLEPYIRIERKNSWSEIADNLATSKGRANLYANIQNLSEVNGVVAIFVEDNPLSIPYLRAFSEFATPGSVVDFWHTCWLKYRVPLMPIGKGPARIDFVRKFLLKAIAGHKEGTSWYRK